MFLDRFDIKNNLKKIKYIILIYFQAKNTLKNNHYYTFKIYTLLNDFFL